MTISRRRVLHLSAGALAAPAVFRAGLARAAETLRLHHFLPPVSNAHTAVLQPWADAVEAASDGAVRVRIFPSMQMGGTPPQLYDQARDGVVDIVWTLPGYTAGRFPRLEVFELPFVAARSGVTNASAVQEYAADEAAQELSETHLLFAWANDHGVLHSGRPLESVDAMSGLAVRFPTRVAGEALGAVGANPIGMPAPQIPEAMAQGVLQAALLPWEVVPALKIHELVGHHVEFPGTPTFHSSAHLLVMNKAKYEGLPDDIRAVIDAQSGLEWAARAGAAWDSAAVSARALAEERGNTVESFSEAEAVRWRELTQPVVDRWVANTPEGAALLEAARGYIAKHAAA